MKSGISDRMKKYSPLLLRVGIAIVLLWFGFSQIKNPSSWVRMLPQFLQSSGNTFIYLNGIFEIIFAILLLLGLFTRLVSLIAGLHLIVIALFVVSGPTGARDVAISIASFAIFLNGPDEFCLDNLIRKKKKHENSEHSESKE